ncbi:sigma factor SigX-regulated lipoprotein [Leptospira santarosai]|uniref:sigma factor SigX-regulated lipoprotein n=1 Tax=Leptospira santarosai TaxID=28183 RepID=UPI0024AFF135|nr:hypothetical protein [Leptospira santarosai]MDI7188162.1 hypothetical protein [Leptospira santarosai]
MVHKKIGLVLLLALLFSNCNQKKDGNSQNDSLLLLAAIQQPKSQGVSGLYAALSILNTNNNPGQQGAYSKGNASPFATLNQSKDCANGGKMTMSGDATQTYTATGASLEYKGTKLTFETCKQTAPMVEGGGTSLLTIEGDLFMDGNITITLDPTSTPTLLKATANTTQRVYSDTYKVNGYLYPKYDVTFTSNNSKLTIENADDIDKASVTIEETVRMTGTVGEEKIESSHTYKTQYKLRQ